MDRSYIACVCSNFVVLLFSIGPISRGDSVGLTRNPALVDNVYNDLLIAIHPDVPENAMLIPQIKKYFTETSATLFNATNRRARFGQIQILIPQTWPVNNEYSKATYQGREKANVVVQKSVLQSGDSPFVVQLDGCRKPGIFMHLTPEFLLNEADSILYWGPIGKALTHELGHLFWGLHDEYVQFDDYQGHYYVSSVSKKGEPVRCAQTIQGKNLNINTGEDCTFDPVTSLPGSDCRFHPDFEGTSSEASLMYYQFLNSVDSFCDNDPGNPELHHNVEAPNRHNRLCRGQSAWEVMRSHKDFASGINPPVLSTEYKEPEFEVLQEQDRKFILIMDISNSMKLFSRLLRMRRAALHFVSDIVPDNSYIGLVDFYKQADVIGELTRVTTGDVRRNIASLLYPGDTHGYTCVGCGLNKALDMVSNDSSGAVFVVISDGEENSSPYGKDIIPLLINKGISVDTILIGKKSDNLLISLASQTGGRPYYVGDDVSTDLEGVMTKLVTSRQLDARQKIVQLVSGIVQVNPSTTYSDKVYIDSTVGAADTMFIFSWEFAGEDFNIALKDPDNILYAISAADKNMTMKMIRKKITNTAVGQWSYLISNTWNQSQNFRVNVMSLSRSPGIEPLSLAVQVGADVQVDYSDDNQRVIGITARLMTEGRPVVNANVTLSIEVNDTMQTVMSRSLLDNGAGADIVKDDGTYSGYVTRFIGNFVYSVRVIAQSEARTSIKVVTPKDSNSGYKFRKALHIDYDVKTIFVEAFNRTDIGIFFVNSNQKNQTDIMPPAMVIDLFVVSVDMTSSETQGLVTLTFTAPGDDLDQGQVQSYEIRTSGNFSTLQNNFPSAQKLPTTGISVALTPPRLAGQAETFTLNVQKPMNDTVYFFALLATDDMGLRSDVSNIVSVKVFRQGHVPTEAPEVQQVVDNSLRLEYIILIAIAGVILLIIVILALVVAVRKRRKKCPTENAPAVSRAEQADRDVVDAALPNSTITEPYTQPQHLSAPSTQQDRDFSESMLSTVFIQDESRVSGSFASSDMPDLLRPCSQASASSDPLKGRIVGMLGEQDEMVDSSVVRGFANPAYSSG